MRVPRTLGGTWNRGASQPREEERGRFTGAGGTPRPTVRAPRNPPLRNGAREGVEKKEEYARRGVERPTYL